MIRKSFVIFAALTCLLTAPAFALDTDYRPYMTIGGGVSLLNETDVTIYGNDAKLSSDVGINGFVGFGLEYQAGRVEFTIDYHLTDLDEIETDLGKTGLDGDLAIADFLVSIYYDFNRDGAISPYFGGGIGVADIRLNDDTIPEGSDNAFAWQLGLGLTFNMSENTKLDLGYKLLSVVEATTGQTEQENILLHNGNAAFRFLF